MAQGGGFTFSEGTHVPNLLIIHNLGDRRGSLRVLESLFAAKPDERREKLFSTREKRNDKEPQRPTSK